MKLSPLTSSILAAPHGFFTRAGGVSEGIYASLNCGAGSQDNAQHVVENRQRVKDYFEAECLCTLYQEHTADVVVVTESSQEYYALGATAPNPTASPPPTWSGDYATLLSRPKADAMVTTRPYLALGILTADCAPVLLHDAENGVIGAAHAGWKGAVGGILANTVEAMCALGAKHSQIRAAIGPCIAQESYQVDMVFHASLLAKDTASEVFFVHDTELSGHYRFDLKGYVAQCLQAAGVTQIEILPQNTYTEESDFFSYRRTTHRKEPDYGRHISVIMLK
jgi:YfiH family protein